MKIMSKVATPDPVECGEFNNGDIYIERKAYKRGNRSLIYLYSCGQLIDLVAGTCQYNVVQAGLLRHNFVNVTTKFTLIQNELYDNQKDTIGQLTDRVKELEGEV